MRTSYFSEILHITLQLCGLDRNLTTPDRFAMIRDFASRRLQKIWESNDWPELKKYSQCQTEMVGERMRIILPASVGQVIAVWSRDPLASTHAIQKDIETIEDGIYLVNELDTTVWVEHRPDAPVLMGDAWSSTQAYNPGAQVYYDAGSSSGSIVPVQGYAIQGDFYTYVGSTPSAPGSAPTIGAWERVRIPRLFADYMAQGAFSDYSRAQASLDVNTLGFIENRAEEAKDHALDQVLRQQGNTRRINFRGY
jgi:hypothetical protein